MSDPPVILTVSKENKNLDKKRKEFQMNSLYENRNSLESREQLLARLGDAICSECQWLSIHKDNCSRKVVK
jgi:hypothetical protein